MSLSRGRRSRASSRANYLEQKNGRNDAANESMFALKEIYNTLKYDWPQLLQEDANPIEMAVSLLDDTSVGMAHKLEEFEALRQQVGRSLKQVVHDQYELFNSSISSYHMLLPLLAKSEQDSHGIKEMLESTTAEIHNKTDSLNELNNNLTKITDIIKILDHIEEMNTIPDKIDQLIVDKKLNEVYDVIFTGYATAEKYNLWSLGAMNGIQSYLDNQSNNLFDMIIDELQNEIYLKSSAGDTQEYFTSWGPILQSNDPQLASLKTLIKESNSLEQFVNNSSNLDVLEVADVMTHRARKFLDVKLSKLHAYYSKTLTNVDYSMVLDANVDTHTESFGYIFLLLNTASRLGRLNQVIEVLNSKAQLELHNLINRSLEQTKLKHAFAINKMSKLQNFEHSRETIIIGDPNLPDSLVVILQDLFGSVFIQFLHVLERHKVVNNIVTLLEGQNRIPPSSSSHNGAASGTSTPRIGSPRMSSPRLDHPPSPTTGSPRVVSGVNTSSPKYKFHEIWNTMKKELQSFIISYIYDASPMGMDNTNLSHVKQTSKVYDVLKRRDIFKLDQVDQKNATKSSDDIHNILLNMFPGLNIGETSVFSNDESKTPFIKSEAVSSTFEVIVPKDLLNMRVIMDFFLIFIAGSHKVFQNFLNENEINGPVDRSAIKFFEDFMRFSFLSRIRDSMDLLFRDHIANSTQNDQNKSIVTQFIGFKTDTINIAMDMDMSNNNKVNSLSFKKTNEMIYQNAYDFKRIFLNLCSTFNTSLTYRIEYTGMVINFLNQFTIAYVNFFKELVSSEEVTYNQFSHVNANKPVSQISKWLQLQRLKDISEVMFDENHQDEEIIIKEINTMLFSEGYDLSRLFTLSKEDYLDNESFDQTCYLLLTVTWILEWLPKLKKESKYEFYLDQPEDLRLPIVDKLKYDWSFYDQGKSNIDSINAHNNNQNIFLALNGEKAQKFDEIINQFRFIKSNSLLALRYDLRCKCVYYIGKSLTNNDWFLSSEPGDADRYISILNNEIYALNNHLKDILNEKQQEQIYLGLGEFINQLLIKGSELITKINSNGIKRIMLNIFILQQMLRNLLNNPEAVNFTDSVAYFNMFTLNEYVFKEQIKKNVNGFSSQEYKNMARLVFSEKLVDGNGSSFNKSKYNELIRYINTNFE